MIIASIIGLLIVWLIADGIQTIGMIPYYRMKKKEKREKERLTAIKKEQKLAAIEEEKRLATIEEAQRFAAIAEEKRLAAIEEAQRFAAIAEEKRLAAIEEEQRLAAIEMETKLHQEKLARAEEVRLRRELLIKNKSFVEDTSLLYKELLKLNKKCNFNTITFNVDNEFWYNSKHSLENVNFADLFYETIEGNEQAFSTLLKQIKENRDLWKTYSANYKKLANLRNGSSFSEVSKSRYSAIENDLYSKHQLLEPCIDYTFELIAKYITPSGSKLYCSTKNYSLSEIADMLYKLPSIREEKEEEYLRVQEAKKAKKVKEKRLKELDKLEEQLAERERILKEMMIDFQKATDGHIYSAEDKIQETIAEPTSNDDTPFAKLQRLKTKYSNGEMRREEYEKKRNELL